MLKKRYLIIVLPLLLAILGSLLYDNIVVSKEEEEPKQVEVTNFPLDEEGNLKVTIADENLWETIYELQNMVDSLNGSLAELLERVEALEMNQTQLLERIEILEEAIVPSNVTVEDFIHDTFAAGLDGWTYWGDTGYSLLWDYPGVVKIVGDGYLVSVGMQKVVDLSGWNGSEPLILSFNWRATSDADYSSITNAQLLIEDPETHMAIYQERLAYGGIYDTGWQSYSRDISAFMSGHNEIRMILWLRDAWIASLHQRNYYDNLRLTNEITL